MSVDLALPVKLQELSKVHPGLAVLTWSWHAFHPL